MRQYRVINGTSYDSTTCQQVIDTLENIRQKQIRVHLSYGFVDGPRAGEDWFEEHEVTGRISRSMGPVKVPIIVYNRRSLGGGGIIVGRIIKIRRTDTNQILYQHLKYNYGILTTKSNNETIDLFRNGKLHANFKNQKELDRWLNKMGMKLETPQMVESS